MVAFVEVELVIRPLSKIKDGDVTVPANVALPADVTEPPAPETPNSIPDLAVINPTESTLVTSSYVKAPVTVKSPVTFAPDEVVSNFTELS